jgi:hypothetical protein
MYHSCVISAPCIIARFWASQQQDWSSKDWVLKTNYEHPTVETLRVIHNSSVVMFQKPQTQFLSGPPEDPTSNHKFRLSSGWVEGLSMYLSCNRMCICFLKNKSQLVKKKNLRKEMIEIQYTMNFWARLSTSCCIPFWQLSFCMSFNKKFYLFWFESKNHSLQKKNWCYLNIFI